LSKVLEFESPAQAFHPIHFLHFPLMDVKQQLIDLYISKHWLATATSDTFSSRKIDHDITSVSSQKNSLLQMEKIILCGSEGRSGLD
jgi:hypothetical protein